MADPRKLRIEANELVAELLSRLAREEVRELEVRRGSLRVRVAKDGAAVVTGAPAAPARASGGPQVVTSAPAAQASELPTVNAPLTGVFYRAASPQAPAFVQVGATVSDGDVIGLIEAMKLFNEIRSTASGKVRRIFVENGQLVKAHQPLIELEPA